LKIQAYIDVASRPGGEVTLHDVMSLIVQTVHHASKHGKVAIGFPTMKSKPGLGDVVRVFAEDVDTLNKVMDFLAEDSRIDEYAIVRRPKSVPEGVLEHEAFVYFRLSHRLSDARMKRLGNLGNQFQQFNLESRSNRADRLNTVDKRGRNVSDIAFATIYSSSTQTQFKLHVERMDCEYSEGEPNGYGLSRVKNIIALPVF